jgi:hypothetical protein
MVYPSDKPTASFAAANHLRPTPDAERGFDKPRRRSHNISSLNDGSGFKGPLPVEAET